MALTFLRTTYVSATQRERLTPSTLTIQGAVFQDDVLKVGWVTVAIIRACHLQLGIREFSARRRTPPATTLPFFPHFLRLVIQLASHHLIQPPPPLTQHPTPPHDSLLFFSHNCIVSEPPAASFAASRCGRLRETCPLFERLCEMSLSPRRSGSSQLPVIVHFSHIHCRAWRR